MRLFWKSSKKIFTLIACFWRYSIITNSTLLSKVSVGCQCALLYVTTLYERVDLIIQLWNRHEL